MPNQQEQTRILKELLKRQVQLLLLNLDAAENVSALKSVLFYLDARAQKLFDQQRELEHANNQKQREEYENLLLTIEAQFPELLN